MAKRKKKRKVKEESSVYDFEKKLSLDLISSFYPFTNEEIIQYQDSIDFTSDNIYKNTLVKWDADLIDELKDKFEFKNLWYLKDLIVDIDFIRRFHDKIDFRNLYLVKNLQYSPELIDNYGKFLDWSSFLLNKEGFNTIENIRKFQDYLDWQKISRNLNFTIDNNFLEEFYSKICWDEISGNPNLQINLELLEMYKDKFNFKILSRNSAAASIILKYPKSSRWDWNMVILNPGIEINNETLPLIVKYYSRLLLVNPLFARLSEDHLNNIVTATLTNKLMRIRFSGIDFLFNHKFKKYYDWKLISESSYSFPKEFFIENVENLEFKNGNILSKNGKYLSSEFIEKNIDKFDLSRYQFYKLELTNKIIDDNIESVNFLWLSSCETITWTWDFIKKYEDKFNIYYLGRNRKIFNDLFGFAVFNENHNSLLHLITKVRT